MDEFDNRRRTDMLVTGVSQCPGCQEDEQGAQSFAAAENNVLSDLRNQLDVRLEAAGDVLVYGFEVASGELHHVIDRELIAGCLCELHTRQIMPENRCVRDTKCIQIVVRAAAPSL